MAYPEPQAPQVVLDVHNLRYAYKNRLALDDVTFRVASRSIHGFVGPNGAGKTTTLKILATLLRPQGGSIGVLGHDLVRHPKAVRRQIGFMPDTLSMYRQMTVFEYLDFFAAAYGLSHAERDQTVKDVLTLTDMEGRSYDLIKNLSKGMLQRVSLARTLVHDPQVLLLDEPAAGLDPRARIELMEILRELRRMGKTVFISSHILAELATLCDSVTIIDRGRIKFSGSMEDLLTQKGESVTYTLRLASDHPPVAHALAQVEGVLRVDKLDDEPAYQITFRRDRLSPNAILQVALQTEAPVAAFQQDTRQLDEAFLDLTEPGVPT
jgi:ABC-2 type transport system ATP-binding protein